MPSFVDLAEELILEIASYFEKRSVDLTARPFYKWSEELESINLAIRQQNQDLQSFSRTCKKLHQILDPNSSCIYIDGKSNGRNKKTLALPRLKSQTISNFDDWTGTPQWRIPGLHVETLYLQNCSGNQLSIQALFESITQDYQHSQAHTQPKALKTVYCETGKKVWLSPDGALEQMIPWKACGRLIKPLHEHKSTLEKLVFTRKVYGPRMDYGDTVGLQGFQNLTSLSISHALLIGENPGRKMDEVLPPSLIELEVFFDDPQRWNFIVGHGYKSRPVWLFGIPQHKQRSTPALERIRIISEEWAGDHEVMWDWDCVPHLDDWVEGKSDASWKPPMELVLSCERENISLGVFLNAKRKFKNVVPGGKWFDDDWEDSWDWKPQPRKRGSRRRVV